MVAPLPNSHGIEAEGELFRRRCLERGWLKRQRGSRAIHLTTAGRRGLREAFGVELADMRGWPHARSEVRFGPIAEIPARDS
jgi:hypothetical protein